jgi:lipoyl(octanoyl) transferase
MARELNVVDVGTMGFGECWELQQRLFNEAIAQKAAGQEPEQKVLLVEHNPVYTLGKSGKESNLLVAEEFLKSIGAEFFHIDRGGDITYHGPGQIVGYPILDLSQLGIGLKAYIDAIEGAVKLLHHVNESLCKGCGICEKSCAFGAITMTDHKTGDRG